MTPTPGKVVGRETELRLVSTLLETPDAPHVVLIEGEPGIGKTTLWEEGVRLAHERSHRVLTCRPAEMEAALPFAALGDLLEPLLPEALPLLPEPQRLALEVALLRVAPPATPTDRLAVSQAVLSVVRGLAPATTVLALDDVQWLDHPSDEVLAFVVRRLAAVPVRLLLARRGSPDLPLPLGLERGPAVRRLEVGPLTIDQLDDVIVTQLDARLPRPRLVELHSTSRGNPYLAIEIVRALVADAHSLAPAIRIPVPESIGALLRRRVEVLSPAANDVLLLTAASPQPRASLLGAVAGSTDGLDEAIGAGILESGEQRVRFTHPLLASVVYSSSRPAERRDAHRRLAAAVSDQAERARHVALGADGPEAAVSAELEATAEVAALRGAPSSAAELLEHAVRLTPAPLVDDRRRRLAGAAQHHYTAGDQARSRSILETLVEELPAGPERARRLAELSQRMPSQLQGLELCRAALAEVGEDSALEADLHFFIAASARRASTLREAAEHAQLSVNCARAAGDGARHARALAMLGHVEVIRGQTRGIERMERAVELEASHGALSLHFRPTFLLGITLLYLGEFGRARPLIEAQLERAERQGDEVMRGVALSSLAELELRAGNWSRAHRCARDGAALQQQAAPLQDQAHHVLRAARVLAYMGSVDEARARVTALLEVAPLNGDKSAEISARRDLGFIELSVDDPAAAVEVLEPGVRHLVELGVGLYAAYPLVHDYVDSLVAVGDRERAEQANALLGRSRNPWEVAMHARGQALIAATRGDPKAAETAIARALAAHDRLGDPFERGRTLLAQGAIERRAKRRSAARAALTSALEIFDHLGAPRWAEKAAAELARIPGRAPAAGELSESERRIAELVATGLANKEIAASLFVTVRTVEGHLTRIYAKLGVRSRTELAARLGRRTGT